MSDHCLACHTEIGLQLQDAASLHGTLMAQSEPSACYTCHIEHRGANAALTIIGEDTFPHLATGYSLLGHSQMQDGAAFSCIDCHGQDFTHFQPEVCADCHGTLDADFMRTHLEAFGRDCLACHDGLDTYGRKFDHNQLAWPLVGRHALVACTDCHPGARSILDLQTTSEDCYGCHQTDDAHDGQFGQGCDQCHTPEDWRAATFDHTQAAFPLTGAHTRVACGQCHVNGVFRGTPKDCVACHREPAYHAGLLGSDCAACHSTDAWAPASYNRAHAFPLDHGEEGPSPCQTCHPANLGSYTCYDCHDPAEIEEKHQDEGISDLQDCIRCHPSGTKDEARGNGDGEGDGGGDN
jgi:hypothetical protein